MTLRARRLGMAALALVVLGTGQPSASPGPARERCGQVVSYFLFPYQGSRIQQHEWRLFDPVRRVDKLVLRSPGGFGDVQWDTTFHDVYFRSGDSLYRMAWRWDATPTLISRFPQGQSGDRWWFNPDSGCWQMIRILGATEADHPYFARYAGELWQSSRDGSRWRRVKADSLDCADDDCLRWNWSNGSPLGKRQPMVTQEDLEAEARFDGWSYRAAPLDTSTVSLLEGEDLDVEWQFLRSERSPRRGVAFRMSYSEEAQFSGPFYLVDLDRKQKTLIPTGRPDAEVWAPALLVERCGFLLMPGASGNALVVDTESGAPVLAAPWNSEGAAWVRAPGSGPR